MLDDLLTYLCVAVELVDKLIGNPWLLSAVFVLLFIGSLFLMPVIVVILPANYFQHDQREPALWADYHPVARTMMLVLKNLLGLVLILVGMAMLVLPGQGLLTMLAGLILLDFPGKYACERWLIRRAPLYKAVSWLREKSGREPLQLP